MRETVSSVVKATAPDPLESALRSAFNQGEPCDANGNPIVENSPVRPKMPTGKPKTWSIIDRETGEKRTTTCMVGCETDHTRRIDSEMFADDVECRATSMSVTLPVNTNGYPEEFRVLTTTMSVMPHAATLAYRLPHVSLELIDDHWIEGMGPDELATVIETLAGRLDALRLAHSQLVAVRDEYKNRTR